MVDKDVPGAVVLQVCDLKAVGGADFSRLEGGVHGIYLHYGFGLSGLQEKNKHFEGLDGKGNGGGSCRSDRKRD